MSSSCAVRRCLIPPRSHDALSPLPCAPPTTTTPSATAYRQRDADLGKVRGVKHRVCVAVLVLRGVLRRRECLHDLREWFCRAELASTMTPTHCPPPIRTERDGAVLAGPSMLTHARVHAVHEGARAVRAALLPVGTINCGMVSARLAVLQLPGPRASHHWSSRDRSSLGSTGSDRCGSVPASSLPCMHWGTLRDTISCGRRAAH